MATHLWPVLAGLLVILGTNVQWTEAGACKPVTCPSGGNKIFNYQPGTTYVYSVEGKTLTDLPQQQGEAVKLELKATAEVNFGAQCSNTLQLKNVQVTGPDAKVYGNLKDLEKYPVIFSFSDGQLSPEICGDADDSNTALNIKRAVISLLQASTPTAAGTSTKTEIDVFGGCPTTFQIEARGSDTVVTKSRNLNKCLYREAMRNTVHTASYAANSELQGSPLLDANQVVEMTVKSGVLHTATSHEVYLYRPFANKDAGAKTVAHTTITFQSKGAKPPHPCKANAGHSIIFDAPHDANTDKSSVAAIVSAMQSCKATMPDNVQMMAATEFRNLVEVLRSSKKDDLLAVYGQVKSGAGFADKDSAKKLFFDALFRAGTGDSVQAAVELLKSKEISGHFVKLWYTSFAFVRHATPESLSAAATLLDADDVPMEAYLGIGALGSRYCSEHSCEGNAHFNDLMVKLSRPLAGGCKCSSFEQENKIVAALKGIENMKEMSEATAELIRVCISDPTVPARVRVAALEAARSDPCQPQIKKTVMELMANTQEDSEIRIKSYLAAVECPCGKCANAVKTLLDSEPVNQVGSFIVSHLRNIRASANPDKALQKLHLAQISRTRKFPFDFRKFSQNYELSGLLDAINVGSSIEANLIYSQKSYLPRSTSLNLTTEIFGHSVNLLEIGTRAENLERLLEKWMGPKGYFKTHTFDQVMESGKSHFDHIKEKLINRREKTVRGKRSVPVNALEQFRQTVYVADRDRSINLDLNVKMFGSTVCHSSYNGDGQHVSIDNMLDTIFDKVDEGIDKAKNFDYNLKHHTLFYENEFAYPTGLGFPLKLTVVGSAAIHMKLNGKLDMHAIFRDTRNMQFQIEAVPSAAVDVTGMMTVDAYAVSAGIKVAAELHTSTGFNANVKFLEGTGVDLTLGLPVKKQEFVNFKTEVLSTVKERGSPAKDTAIGFTTKRKEFQGCFDQLSKALGVTFCSEIGVPFEGTSSNAALFPLNGPSKFAFSVQMDDVQSFKLKGYFNTQDKDRRAFEFLIDTPNSQTNRKVEMVMELLKEPNLEYRVKFSSPIKTALAELIFVYKGKENSIAARVMNDDNEYFAKLGAEVSGTDERRVYKPSFEYRMPGSPSEKLVKGKGSKGKPSKQKAGPEYNVEGTIIVEKSGNSRKYTFDGLCLTIPIGKVTLNGDVGHDDKSIHTDLQIQRDKDTITLKGKGEIHASRHFTVNGQFQISNYPDLGISLDWMYNRGADNLESKLVLVHGQDLSSQQACLTAHTVNKYHYNKETKDFGFDGFGTLTYPLLGVDAKIQAKLAPHSASYEIRGAYDKYSIESKGHSMTGIKSPGDYDIAFEAKILDNYAMFSTKRDVLSPHDNRFTTVLDLKPRTRYELTVDTTCKMETTHTMQKLLAVLKQNDGSKDHTLDLGLEASPAVFASHAKFSIGSNDMVDFLTKINKGPSPSGNFKAIVKDHLDGSGEFSFGGGKGSLSGYLKLLKVQRMMKATGSMATTGTRRQANIEVSFDEGGDPSKSIRLDTDCDLKPDSISNKHVLVVFGYKTVLNFKGERTGTAKDGTVKGSADLTLPTEHHIAGSFDQELHAVGEEANGAWKFELSAAETKDSPARSVILDIKADHCNRQNLYYDLAIGMVYKDTHGKDVKYSVATKHLPNGNKRHFEFQGQVEGSMLTMAPMVHVKADIEKPVINFYGKAFLTADSNVEFTGMVETGKEGFIPHKYECTVDLNLPTGELKHVKIIDKIHYVPAGEGTPFELGASSLVTYNGINTVKFNMDFKGSRENGQGQISISLPKDELRVFKTSYHIGKGPGIEREASVTLIHGQKEGFLEMKVKVPEDKNSFHFTVNGRTPSEKIKTFGIVINSLRSETIVEGDATITVDDQKVEVKSKYSRDWSNPMFEIGVIHPKGKSFVGFFFRHKGVESNHYEGEFKYEHLEEKGYLKADLLIPSVHEFTITMDADSTRFNLNQVHLVITNEQGVKGGKSLSILQTEAGETTVTGKLNYAAKDGEDGVLFEANGAIKVHGQNRPCKVILKKQVITSPIENGFEYYGLASLGDKSIESLYKQTTREVHYKFTACKSADSCGKSEYLSKFSVDGTDFSSEMLYEVDTTGLGATTDYSFSRITYKKGTEFLHKIQFDNNKKQIFLYKFGFDHQAASTCLITPSREMAMESTYSMKVDQKSNKNDITYQYEASAWLDKLREPDNKLTFVAEAIIAQTGGNVNLNAETKLKHPALPQDMVVKYSGVLTSRQGMSMLVDIDVFAKKAQKIVIEGKYNSNPVAGGYNYTSLWSVKSKGQKLDISLEEHYVLSWSILGAGSVLVYNDEKGKRDLGFGIELTSNKAAIFVKSPKEMLVDIGMSYDFKELPSGEMFVSFLGCQGVVGKAHFEPGNRLVYYVYKKNTPDNRVTGELCVDPLSKIHNRLDWVHGGVTKELMNVGIALDSKATPDLVLNYLNMQILLEYLRNDLKVFVDQAKLVSDELQEEVRKEMNDIAEGLKKSQPNLRPLVASYQKQLQTLRTEITSEPSVQEMSDIIKKFAGSTSELFGQVTEMVAKIADKLLDLFDEFSNAILGSLKRIMPQATDSCKKIFSAGLEIFNALATQALNRVNDIIKFCQQHEPEIKQIGMAIAEMTRTVFQSISKTSSHIVKEVKELMVIVIDQIKAMPVFAMLQERIDQLKEQATSFLPTEQIYTMLHEATKAIKDTMPTQELRDFIDCLSTYFEKLLKKDKIDYNAEGKKIYQKGIAAFKSVIVLLKTEMGDKDASTAGILGVSWPISMKSLFKIPIAAGVHFSPLEYLRTGDFPRPTELLLTYFPRSLNPLDQFPPFKAYGMVVDSSNIVTFDNRYFAFKGTCSYILVQDVTDGNFTVVMNLEKNGKFKSIALSDSQDVVEFTAQKGVLLNGKPSELPVKTDNLNVWRHFHSIVMRSSAGVEVELSFDYSLAEVRLSGFYHGRVRGLLGDSNYEPFDDFRLPTGQICTDVAELVNAYSVGGECAPSVAIQPKQKQEPACSAVFSADTNYGKYFPIYSPDMFREMCNTFVASTTTKKQVYACRVAAAFVLRARYDGFLFKLPASCASCPGPSKPLLIGETMSVKVPSQKADIVFVVEQVLGNAEVYKDLVTPLVPALTADLKAKGITDINFSLLGYGHPKLSKPELHTTSGKISYDGKANLEFGEPPKRQKTWGTSPSEKLAFFLDKIRVEAGIMPFMGALEELMYYPMRAGASKAIVIVTADSCDNGMALGFQKFRELVIAAAVKYTSLSVHIVSPMEGFNIVGVKDAKTQKNVVGFDADTVYTFADGKKKSIDGCGNADLRSEIEYNKDWCIEVSQKSNGAAYNAHNFLEAKAGQRKQFVQMMVNKLSQSLTTEYTDECTCKIFYGIYPRNVCSVKGRKESERLSSQTETIKGKSKGGKKPKN